MSRLWKDPSCRNSRRHLTLFGLVVVGILYALHQGVIETYCRNLANISSSASTLASGSNTGPSPLFPQPPSLRESKGLTVTTLAYKVPYDRERVTHNCRMISNTRHRFIIYTDEPLAPYCTLCHCRPFVPTNCPPPNPSPDSVNHCEKLAFVARMVPRLQEMVYLDSDLIIMKRFFLDHLEARSHAHDFLASYDQSGYREVPKYYTFMNSGLFFMRFLKTANYSDLMPRMYKYQTGFDQSIITGFIFDEYRNWDTFSWKWHCRAMMRTKQDIPLRECYTIHDRTEEEVLRQRLNFSLLTIL